MGEPRSFELTEKEAKEILSYAYTLEPGSKQWLTLPNKDGKISLYFVEPAENELGFKITHELFSDPKTLEISKNQNGLSINNQLQSNKIDDIKDELQKSKMIELEKQAIARISGQNESLNNMPPSKPLSSRFSLWPNSPENQEAIDRMSGKDRNLDGSFKRRT